MRNALVRAPVARLTSSSIRHGSAARKPLPAPVRNRSTSANSGAPLAATRRRALVLMIPETDGTFALHDVEAVEDAAADVPGALERVPAGAGQQDRLLARGQGPREIAVLGVSEQAPADAGYGDHRGMKLHERIVRASRLGSLDRGRIASFQECAVDPPDGELQPPHRPFCHQLPPVPDLVAAHVHLARRRSRVRARDHAAEPQGPGHLQAGADDAVVDHHDGHGGAAHDVHVAVRARGAVEGDEVEADVAVDDLGHAPLRNPDEDDGLVVLHEADDAADHPVEADPHEDADGLAGIAGGVDDVGGDEYVPDGAAGGERIRHRQGADGGNHDAVGAGERLAGRQGFEKALQIRAGGRRRRNQKQRQHDGPSGARTGSHIPVHALTSRFGRGAAQPITVTADRR